MTTVVPGPSSNPLPPPSPAPTCVRGALVTPARVCGLGVAGRAYRWNDERMRALARRNAAQNLAGMLRALVTSALVIHQDDRSMWSREERYLEIDEGLIDSVEASAEIELWFDVLGEGPFRAPERTYACACMTSAEAGIRIDAEQVEAHAFARQYSVDEVPGWLVDVEIQNRALRCVTGTQERMFFPEDMLAPLTDSVRAELVERTRSWVLSELDDRVVCAGQSRSACTSTINSVLEAANEGVTRGVALTAVWLDARGIGPLGKKDTAYGWGCVFDQLVLEAARRRLQEIRGHLEPRAAREDGAGSAAVATARGATPRSGRAGSPWPSGGGWAP